MNALIATQKQIDQINKALAGGPYRVAGIPSATGELQLGSDLLDDCEPGGNYEAAASILAKLTIKPWTAPEDSSNG